MRNKNKYIYITQEFFFGSDFFSPVLRLFEACTDQVSCLWKINYVGSGKLKDDMNLDFLFNSKVLFLWGMIYCMNI